MARAQEHHDGLFEFVLSQLRRGGDTDALREVLQLFAIPVAVLEVAHRHRRREGVGHAATAYLFRRRRPTVVAPPLANHGIDKIDPASYTVANGYGQTKGARDAGLDVD